MTLVEIGQLVNVDQKTVLRWAHKAVGSDCTMIGAKCTKAETNKVAADFTLPETIAIIRAGGNETLADLLAQNAAQQLATIARPTANEIREYRLLFDRGILTRDQVQARLGFDPRQGPSERITRLIPAQLAATDDGLELLLSRTDRQGNPLSFLVGRKEDVHFLSSHGIRLVGTDAKPVLAVASRHPQFKALVGEAQDDHTIDNYLRSHPRLIVASTMIRFALGSTRARLLTWKGAL